MRALRKLSGAARRFVERDRPVILMYHRVARVAHDPWQLGVWPERFADQIEALVQLRHVVPLRWLASELAQARVPKKVAAVTFDDGYADVFTEAKPVLDRFGCPATIFLVTGAIGTSCGFWWDELARIILETPSLPCELELDIAGWLHRWRTNGRLTGSANEPIDEPRGCTREELHEELWRLLRPLQSQPRWELLAQLCTWAGIEIQAKSAHRALNAEEVRRLAEPGFTDIGAHTVTHPALSLLDEAGQRSEIERSRAACEELIGEPIQTFAYPPFGDFGKTTPAYIRDAGLACACTTVPGRVSMRTDPMLLPRITVGNWAGSALAHRLTAWFGRG